MMGSEAPTMMIFTEGLPTTTPSIAADLRKPIADDDMTNDDAAWVLQCGFLILTMQTGFAMLEGGYVSSKNMANIMVKNVCDVCIGGLAYWSFGYGLTFGEPSNSFSGYGDFFFRQANHTLVGSRFTHYFFQFSFASTATTIVSGAVAERMKFHAYMIFSFLNVVIYAIPASWCWGQKGFLKLMGFYDFSGSCVVHLNGGASSLMATVMLGPRLGRFENPEKFQMGSPVTALTGMFMLTWAWLAFNCGSTFGITGHKWKIGALVAACTLNGAIGGGLTGLATSMAHHKLQVRVDYVITSILGGLVCISGSAAIVTTMEALVIGAVGALVAIYTGKLMERLYIDDPVGAIPVHFSAAIWGTIAVGLFGRENADGMLNGYKGIFYGGSGHLLGVNLLGATLVTLWSGSTTFLILFVLDKTMGIRMSPQQEILGADFTEHCAQERTGGTASRALEEAINKLGELEVARIVEDFVDDQVWKGPTQHLNKHAVHPQSDRPIGTKGQQMEGNVSSRTNNDEGSPHNHSIATMDDLKVRFHPMEEHRPGKLKQILEAIVAPSEYITLARQRRSSITATHGGERPQSARNSDRTPHVSDWI